MVNRHNVRIWGTENPHVIIQHVRDPPKVNVFCAISKKNSLCRTHSHRDDLLGGKLADAPFE
jgi:hypothetical protein